MQAHENKGCKLYYELIHTQSFGLQSMDTDSMPSAILPWHSLSSLKLHSVYSTSLGSPPLIFSLLSTLTSRSVAFLPPQWGTVTFCAYLGEFYTIFLLFPLHFVSSLWLLSNRIPYSVAGHLCHFPLSLHFSRSFCRVSFILSYSLYYIIQASASHSEIKACNCVPSNSLLTGGTGRSLSKAFKEAEMPSMTADVGNLQSKVCISALHHFSFIFTSPLLFAQVNVWKFPLSWEARPEVSLNTHLHRGAHCPKRTWYLLIMRHQKNEIALWL